MTASRRSDIAALQVHRYHETPIIAVDEIPPPTCGPHDVVVAPRAAALHVADLLMMKGEYQVRPELPFVPGMEAAGLVIEVGDQVTHLARGDRVLAVMTRGAIAGAVVVPGAQVARIPDSMTYSAAATFGIAYFTAYAALHFRAGLRAGETVLVTGALGGVARAVAQLAKAAGASVLAASRDLAEARSELREHVDEVVDADPDSIAEVVKHRTEGRGADVVVDVVGGPLLGQLVRATAWEGRLVIVGFAAGTPSPIKPGHLLVKNISVLGLQSTDYWPRRPYRVQAALGHLLSLVDAGALSIPEPREFRLDEIDLAIRAVTESSRRGVVILIDQDERTAAE
ncbi:NADPH:quinone oxidoreductase family protein (plasmid) [Rhodococcus opacus]|jgi:NADPH2:quinone reductase|uniref:NADPH:quinone oxidoreductase family protein n=1 Tax=Rhodococcus opacus TaxID=37919 RepID=UPI001C9D6B5A|nr:NADPH:quinone oxidoreductase family protein [Rhodococcus opacus]QZS52762.1 NADPH:quinone oxidoreductase family protein [Rhodococcus opacus]